MPSDPSPHAPSQATGFTWPWLVAYAALVGLCAFSLVFVRFNHTPSLPRGAYLCTPLWSRAPQRGDDVFACMAPGAGARLAVERGYLEASTRDCASGAIPLLKHVLAAPGDTVVLGPDGVVVGGRRIAPAPPVRDRAGRPLQPVYGRHVLGPGDLWLGSDIANGYDSRYLGPLPDSLVLGRAYRLVRF